MKKMYKYKIELQTYNGDKTIYINADEDSHAILKAYRVMFRYGYKETEIKFISVRKIK